MNEIWKPIAGYEDVYEVSSMGQVRSLPRKITSGTRIVTLKGKVLKQAKSGGKEMSSVVSLNHEGEAELVRVNRLVYRTFVGEIPDDHVIVHKSRLETFPNRASNLLCLPNSEFHKAYSGALREQQRADVIGNLTNAS